VVGVNKLYYSAARAELFS